MVDERGQKVAAGLLEALAVGFGDVVFEQHLEQVVPAEAFFRGLLLRASRPVAKSASLLQNQNFSLLSGLFFWR